MGPDGRDLLDVIGSAVGEHVRDLRHLAKTSEAMIDELRQEIQSPVQEAVTREMQEAGAMAYRGVWQEGHRYTRNHVVTDKGSLWIALAASKDVRPGSAPRLWKLIVKQGSLA